MKITKNVIEQYQFLCPISSGKCDSFHDIEYKITRCITLGQVVEIRDNGKTHIVRYYHLNFTVTKNKVVGMISDKSKSLVFINEKAKSQYDQIHSKLVV